MGKLQDGFVTVYVSLFIVLTSQISCTSQILSRSGIGSPGSLQMMTIDGNQQNLKESNLIKNLPGQPRVGFKQYGGYVAVDKSAGRFFYYYFVEATKSSASSPLVIWFNGGPGCSSLQGAFLENGPFRVHSDGRTLYHNPYSWNNEANMLYIESPAGVGFSYTNTPSDFNKIGDKMTAEDNYSFLVKWLEKFTEYKGRELYITGQSYAGHYVPQLAQIILHRNNKTFINLKGILIGNPGLDRVEERKGDEEFLADHAIISREMLDRKKEVCNFEKSETRWGVCLTAMNPISDMQKNIDPYNLYASKCLDSTLTSKPKRHTTILKNDPCSSHYLESYLRTTNVQEAIHANTSTRPFVWNQCNDSLNWPMSDTDNSMVPVLHELMREGVRVFVYSGDVDPAVSVTSTKYTLKKMNLTIEKTWRPWFSEGEVGGYIEEYKGNFTYATVRGAGHDVPSDQPKRALTLFTNFIRNTPLPQL